MKSTRSPRAAAPLMNWSSQPPARSPPDATAGLPSVIPVASSWGHRLSACDTDMLDWLLRSGSLNPSRTLPSVLTWARVALVTLAAPQICGTKDTPAGLLIPDGLAPQL